MRRPAACGLGTQAQAARQQGLLPSSRTCRRRAWRPAPAALPVISHPHHPGLHTRPLRHGPVQGAGRGGLCAGQRGDVPPPGVLPRERAQLGDAVSERLFSRQDEEVRRRRLTTTSAANNVIVASRSELLPRLCLRDFSCRCSYCCYCYCYYYCFCVSIQRQQVRDKFVLKEGRQWLQQLL